MYIIIMIGVRCYYCDIDYSDRCNYFRVHRDRVKNVVGRRPIGIYNNIIYLHVFTVKSDYCLLLLLLSI